MSATRMSPTPVGATRMSRLLGFAAIVMLTLTGAIVLWQFRLAVALFLLSLAVASAIRPAVLRLERGGLSRPVAVAITYLAGLSLLIVVGLLLGGPLLAELETWTDRLAMTYEHLYPAWASGSALQAAIAARLPAPDVLYQALTGPDGGSLAQHVLGLTRGLLGLAGGLLLVLVFGAYWTIDQIRLERLWLSLLPVAHRAQARDLWRAAIDGTGDYLRSEVVQSAIALLLLALGYQALGLEIPLTLALFGAVVWLVPLVGVLLTIPPVFLAGLEQGLPLGLAAVLFTLVVLWLLEFLVEPRLFDRRRTSAILTVLLMLVLVQDGGLLGLLAAPPLAAAVQSFAARLWRTSGGRDAPAPAIAGLRERLAALRATLDENGNAAPEAANLADRLAALIERAEEATAPATPAPPQPYGTIPSALPCLPGEIPCPSRPSTATAPTTPIPPASRP